ncbi:Aldo/keto reductase [Durotheca rogersii]|uniref:Aldo/keto reductase n=1 Tax=Durotheca rogersii TaxID=419775 RepID=UPI00221F17C5|nr:Aldo/keto reductase [Durotheca rogersii]KAI5865378.1 Aldo/keto reductase [Durotheca rogersii]
MAVCVPSSDDFAERFVPLKLSSGRVHPYLVYGTGSKHGDTSRLTTLALKNGFRAVDTANYPTAYDEALVGDAVQGALKSGLARDDLLIQTKFTPSWAHAEGKLSYEVCQPLEAQVHESIEKSFQHLKVDRIDILLLHAPFKDDQDNILAWKVFETFVPDRIGALGASNFSLPAFEKLYDAAKVKPQIVQNRFDEDSGYDIGLRAFLKPRGVIYQTFSLLRGNRELLASGVVGRLATQYYIPKEVALCLLTLGLGNLSIVNGTTDEEHMRIDVETIDRLLGDEDAVLVLKSYMQDFEDLIKEIGCRVLERSALLT